MNNWIPLSIQIPEKGEDVWLLSADGSETIASRCNCHNTNCMEWRSLGCALIISPTHWKKYVKNNYKYWMIWYLSCEGNKRWGIAETPSDWDNDQIKDQIKTGGCGDDVAEIISIEETMPSEYNVLWKFDNE